MMRRTQPMTYPNRWVVGEWTFWEIEGHGFSDIEGPLYSFTVGLPGVGQQPRFTELYESLDEAMVAAVGEKYTGRRGAGGTAVGTAADWFMEMIGARRDSRLHRAKDHDRPKSSNHG